MGGGSTRPVWLGRWRTGGNGIPSRLTTGMTTLSIIQPHEGCSPVGFSHALLSLNHPSKTKTWLVAFNAPRIRIDETTARKLSRQFKSISVSCTPMTGKPIFNYLQLFNIPQLARSNLVSSTSPFFFFHFLPFPP
jgi:hypothetical protein